ncbi:ATP-binding cassette domain-containing protein [Williamsia sterculiae]|uniref:ABC-2 type transport system ATP-binding protein n=1 Tax=Williamsia sterculiae TaxID=1344003 RepID=A0A1N7GQL3_9NOCA|nr:ATP-binding cassette domain-containing protein [Williamsia sterculiae]SIS14846.1 ABC-2 type transport system ATP-binding protein [Williamsia sterculiae]
MQPRQGRPSHGDGRHSAPDPDGSDTYRFPVVAYGESDRVHRHPDRASAWSEESTSAETVAFRRPAESPEGAPSTSNSVVADNLVKRFGDFTAVDGISFTVPTGSVLGLLGPNGAGKTTTVNMLCTLLTPDGGTATIAGHDVVRDRADVRKSIMLTGQFAALDEALTGRENLILFGRLMGLSPKGARARADELLEAFDLTKAASRRVGKFSGGMRRRIDIACGLVVRPEVVFLDEPTTGLDPRSRQDVWDIVSSLSRLHITTLLTTQYLEEADLLSDRIVVIDKGRVIAEGTADELKAQVAGTFCEIVPTSPADLPRLQDALAGLAAEDQIRVDLTRNSLTVPAAGTDVLVEVVRRTDIAGIALSDVGLRRPSLDDVFLELTDRPADAGTE